MSWMTKFLSMWLAPWMSLLIIRLSMILPISIHLLCHFFRRELEWMTALYFTCTHSTLSGECFFNCGLQSAIDKILKPVMQSRYDCWNCESHMTKQYHFGWGNPATAKRLQTWCMCCNGDYYDGLLIENSMPTYKGSCCVDAFGITAPSSFKPLYWSTLE